MLRLLLATCLVLGLASPSAIATDAAPDAEIEAVIADQIAAFRRDDPAAAFAHAGPGIRARFGTPENFAAMVRTGYPMIWRPARWEWRGLTPADNGSWIKTVLFEDAQGALHEADYLMAPVEGGWRIHGVSLRRLPGATS